MTKIETRRVQKLGASSLIITLPKDWAKEFGISPGMIVYLKKEGNSIKIMASGKKEEETYLVEFDGPGDQKLAEQALTCLYIMGISNAKIVGNNINIKEVEIEAKRRALDLIGVEAFAEGDVLRIRVLVDVDRTNLSIFAKTVGLNALKTVRLLKRIVVDGYSDTDMIEEETSLLQKDAIKYQHAILRAFSRGVEESDGVIRIHNMAMLSRHLVLVTNIIIDIINIMLRVGIDEFPHEAKVIVSKLEEIMSDITNNIISNKRINIDQFDEETKFIIDKSIELLVNKKNSLNTQTIILLSKLITIGRLLRVIQIILVCAEIAEKMRVTNENEN